MLMLLKKYKLKYAKKFKRDWRHTRAYVCEYCKFYKQYNQCLNIEVGIVCDDFNKSLHIYCYYVI